jgi:hypothetical protein
MSIIHEPVEAGLGRTAQGTLPEGEIARRLGKLPLSFSQVSAPLLCISGLPIFGGATRREGLPSADCRLSGFAKEC